LTGDRLSCVVDRREVQRKRGPKEACRWGEKHEMDSRMFARTGERQNAKSAMMIERSGRKRKEKRGGRRDIHPVKRGEVVVKVEKNDAYLELLAMGTCTRTIERHVV